MLVAAGIFSAGGKQSDPGQVSIFIPAGIPSPRSRTLIIAPHVRQVLDELPGRSSSSGPVAGFQPSWSRSTVRIRASVAAYMPFASCLRRSVSVNT